MSYEEGLSLTMAIGASSLSSGGWRVSVLGRLVKLSRWVDRGDRSQEHSSEAQCDKMNSVAVSKARPQMWFSISFFAFAICDESAFAFILAVPGSVFLAVSSWQCLHPFTGQVNIILVSGA
jgi:hypothetical protein